MSYLRSRIAAATVILIKRQQLKGRQARKILYRNEQRPLCQYCNRRLKDRLSWYVHMRAMHGMTMELTGFQMHTQTQQLTDCNNSRPQAIESTTPNLQQAESKNFEVSSGAQEFHIEEFQSLLGTDQTTGSILKHEEPALASKEDKINEEKSALEQLGEKIRALRVLIDEKSNVDGAIKSLLCDMETSYSRVLHETRFGSAAPLTVKDEYM